MGEKQIEHFQGQTAATEQSKAPPKLPPNMVRAGGMPPQQALPFSLNDATLIIQTIQQRVQMNMIEGQHMQKVLERFSAFVQSRGVSPELPPGPATIAA